MNQARWNPHVKLSLVGASAVLVLIALVAFFSTSAMGAPPLDSHARQGTANARQYATQRAGMPPAKAAYFDIGATALASITPHPERKIDLDATFRALPTPVVITGIVDARSNPYRRLWSSRNQWWGTINGVNYSLFGTSMYMDDAQGMIGVAKTGPDGNDLYTEYPTPGKHGALRITAVNGALVSFVAKDGTPFTFDVATLTFK